MPINVAVRMKPYFVRQMCVNDSSLMQLKRMNLNALIATVIVSVTVAIRPGVADACQCVGPVQTCGVLAAATSVLEATVDSIELSSGVRRVVLRDVKAWRGPAATTVITAESESSCGYEFKVGTRYLIVADRASDGRLAVSRCGLTRPLSEATGLRDYLQLSAASASSPPIRVWGQVVRASRWNDFAREFTGVSDAEITLQGPIRRSIRSAPDGYYFASDLPPGRYAVTVTMPRTMPQLGPVRAAALEVGQTPAAACFELDFVAPIESSISGVVVDASGRPAGGTFVSLRLPDQLDYSRGSAGGGFTTDFQGRYEFKDLPPGRYVIGVSTGNGRGDQLVPGEVMVGLRFGERLTLDPLVVRRLWVERR